MLLVLSSPSKYQNPSKKFPVIFVIGYFDNFRVKYYHFWYYTILNRVSAFNGGRVRIAFRAVATSGFAEFELVCEAGAGSTVSSRDQGWSSAAGRAN
ncbi:hypothetical protein B9G39_06070 [Zooshikella ganghwensis]|uniref:Uncharacterized protein n=1 Tax=Zooshikella ganghwensis TaxID=202772 RepID=A0A4P9VMB6_9GAMM|nr:hypothetical protein B9G39_06070 [Zooshikella ganghwensis]